MDSSDTSYSSDGIKPCNCGHDGDYNTDKCEDCHRYVCSNKCGGIVLTDQGTYCTDCVESIVLIHPDPLRPMEYFNEYGELVSDTEGKYNHSSDNCDRCDRDLYKDSFISLAGCIICRDCLETIVKEACGK